MQLIIEKSHEGTSRRAATLIAEEIRRRPDLLMCAASGNSPTRSYELLGAMAMNQPEAFREVRLLKLDEWAGLGRRDPASCDHYLRRYLLEPLAISEERYLGFQSDCEDLEAECRRLRSDLDRHGRIDLCVLGLGVNGHIGFNEPADSLEPFAHAVRLTEASLQHPMLDDAEKTVQWGLTIGMADILHARRIVLIVNGQHKNEPLQRFLSGRISTDFPASLLWLHSNMTCLCDSSAIGDPDTTLQHCLSGPHFLEHKADWSGSNTGSPSRLALNGTVPSQSYLPPGE